LPGFGPIILPGGKGGAATLGGAGPRTVPQQGGLLHESLYIEGAKYHLERNEVDECYARFVSFDKSRTGSINKDELKDCLRDCVGNKMDQGLIDRVANMHMQTLDREGKGHIPFPKFIELYSQLKASSTSSSQGESAPSFGSAPPSYGVYAPGPQPTSH